MILTSQPHSNRTNQVEIFRPKRWREFWLVRQVTCSADGQLAAGFPRGRFITYANLCLNIHRIVFRGNWFRFEVKVADFGGKTKIGQWQRADQVSWSARVRWSAESWLRQRFHVFGGWSALGVVCLVIGTFNQLNCCVSLQVNYDGNRRKFHWLCNASRDWTTLQFFPGKILCFSPEINKFLPKLSGEHCVWPSTLPVIWVKCEILKKTATNQWEFVSTVTWLARFFAKFPRNFDNFDISRH